MGRIVIPVKWRKKWGKKVVMVRLSDEVMVRTLRKKGKLTDLPDAIEVPDLEDFGDTHELRRAVYGFGFWIHRYFSIHILNPGEVQ